MSRPELQGPPELYYDASVASTYSANQHTISIQSDLTNRCLDLIYLPEASCCVLDIGCGSGLSGDVISERGHEWVGIDISAPMLQVGQAREVDGDLIYGDMGQLQRFRPGVFDGAVSISAIQWLCQSNKKTEDPYKRACTFFQWLVRCLAAGARAALQFYPSHAEQTEVLLSAAMRAGFEGGLVVDYPNSSRAKKYYLCLWNGSPFGVNNQMPQALTDEKSTVEVGRRAKCTKTVKKGKPAQGTKEWILKKKERRRRLGLPVRPDTKYTGKKRKDRF
ncbi:MAG: hypothetical protein KVP17_000042 [Porospora cf. gigantea B]|uniref:uncharacterized protein n=1 Tax=Porospora cf. gigantea B TaxID=2853592 RepID=UPI0035717D06|nr:MAG: hypothetical protein KVP17_000042 [Porospora cf. gigantea B]